MKKIIIAIVIVLVLLPIVPKLLPKPLTFEQVETAFKEGGYAVSGVRVESRPFLKAVEQVNMIVDGAQVSIYRFDNEGEIATQLEYQKTDSGSAMVEAWNLSESLGAAKPKSKPVSAGRNGLFMITVASDNADLRNKLVAVFKAL